MNNQPKILHICNLDKFIPPFIDFIRDNFSDGNNTFAIVAGASKYNHAYTPGSDTRRYKYPWQSFRLFYDMWSADKIIVHGLSALKIILLLVIQPWAYKKIYWIMWGKDLYAHIMHDDSLITKTRESLKHFLIPRIGGLITYIPGDVERARQWYGATGQYCECLCYTSNTVDSKEVPIQLPGDGKTRILIGNSADPTNRHLDVFDKIHPYVDDNTLLYIPLSYGDEAHAQTVIESGKRLFGNRCIPLTKFIPPDEYRTFLSTIDIALFNHKRQQAMGTALWLLSQGVQVYMRSDVAQWHFFMNKHITVFDIEKIGALNVDFDGRHNMARTRALFSNETLVKQWHNIFFKG